MRDGDAVYRKGICSASYEQLARAMEQSKGNGIKGSRAVGDATLLYQRGRLYKGQEEVKWKMRKRA